ncbi:hypothetical protein QOT17_025388 [Balamuthia mandrillaris]
MLTILFAVCSFSDWLYGSKFMIFLNHKAKNNTLNYWALFISEYNFKIVYCPDVHMVLEDCFFCLYPPIFWDNSGLAPPTIPVNTPCLPQCKPRDLKALVLIDGSPLRHR